LRERLSFGNILFERARAWGNLAEICKQYLTKGQQVYIEGRLQTRYWEDKEGNKHSSTEIVANEMIMLGDRRDSNQASSELSIEEEDEFPF
jgi:single-strand DNA-binding protein